MTNIKDQNFDLFWKHAHTMAGTILNKMHYPLLQHCSDSLERNIARNSYQAIKTAILTDIKKSNLIYIINR